MKSASKKRRAQKGRSGHTFLGLAKDWIDSPQWAGLDSFEVKLLIDLGAQHNGHNNGDLCAAWTLMRRRGWRSTATLNKTLHSLIDKGWLLLTRQGGRHTASLYALTVWGIDPCGGKHDETPCAVPLHLWKNRIPGRVVNQCGRVANQLPPDLSKKSASVVAS